MDKNIQIGMLYEFYGNLLTDKQSFVIDSYYNNDLSLSELAENLDITRQGVLKQIKDAEKSLLAYEEKLGLMKTYYASQKGIEQIAKELNELKDKNNSNKIDEIISQIENLI